ncbi:MAG: aldo/keto reductase family protein [candidate division FCPU426 bacterium]
MKYRKLGASGLEISEISLGSWMTVGGSIEDATSAELVRRAFDLGVNFFDTANAYNAGKAEEILGKELAQFKRSSVVVATKTFWDLESGPNLLGLSRKHIMESCDASLKRLNMDYVDLFQCHRYDPTTPLLETLRALDDLQSAGKILYAGVSQWSAAEILEARRLARKHNLRPLISDQPVYNLLNRGQEKEVMPACDEVGMGWVIYSPLAQGLLTGKYANGKLPKGSRAADEKRGQWLKALLTPENLKKTKGLAELARSLTLSSSQLALAWALSKKTVASAITGATSVSQLEENAKASDITLSAKTLTELESLFPL